MKNNNQPNKTTKKKITPLSVFAVAIAVTALSVAAFSSNGDKKAAASANAITVTESNGYVPATLNANKDIVIKVSDISEKATFYKYNSNGTTMGVFAVKASDGTIRTAFDTCQICNGSPKAYFEQKGNTFQCQNCGNVYNQNMIGQERGGCNPVPITSDEKIVTDNEIIIPAKVLNDNASIFKVWKKI